MTNIATQTLASIVTNNSQAVPVLEKYNLDFCCKGKRTLAQACEEKGLFVDLISLEIESQTALRQAGHMPFEEMTCEQLINYILIHHHFYVKQSMPLITGHLEKVANKHGEKFPFMKEVFHLFSELQNDMTHHMQKEEMILFPRIKQMEQLIAINKMAEIDIAHIQGPVSVLMNEHDKAGELLYQIRELTKSYEVPADACTTFRVSLAELKEYEEDLHKHVHLENNHLFPKAIQMMEEINPVTVN